MCFDKKYLFIVAPPRSGSTLLQGLLSTSDDIQMWGENENFFYGQFESIKRLRYRQEKQPPKGNPTKIFYGLDNYNEQEIIASYKELNAKILNRNAKQNSKVVGFKEVRYFERNDTLDEYLDFMEVVFEEAKFIWLTRNISHVIESADLANFNWGDPARSREKISKFNDILKKRMRSRNNVFHLDYNDMKNRNFAKIQEMFEFAGVAFSKEQVEKSLDTQHGFRSRVQ